MARCLHLLRHGSRPDWVGTASGRPHDGYRAHDPPVQRRERAGIVCLWHSFTAAALTAARGAAADCTTDAGAASHLAADADASWRTPRTAALVAAAASAQQAATAAVIAADATSPTSAAGCAARPAADATRSAAAASRAAASAACTWRGVSRKPAPTRGRRPTPGDATAARTTCAAARSRLAPWLATAALSARSATAAAAATAA